MIYSSLTLTLTSQLTSRPDLSPYLCTCLLRQVRIRDKNDKPTVTSPENDFAFELPEDAYQGTVIPVPLPDGTALTVKATDPDDPDTNNAKLVYSLLPDSTPDDANDLFYVRNTSAVLRVVVLGLWEGDGEEKLRTKPSLRYQHVLFIDPILHAPFAFPRFLLRKAR